MTKINMAKLTRTCTVACLPILGAIFACSPDSTELQTGDAQTASAARASMNAGLNKLTTVGAEITNTLANYRHTEPAQLLLPSTQQFPPAPVTKAALSPLYGTYVEQTAGQFNFVYNILPFITIEYLNGVDVKFSFISYDANNHFKGLAMSVSSNNRLIDTPAAEEVTISYLELRNDHGNDIPTLDAYNHTIIGDAAYIDSSGAAKKYGFWNIQSLSTNEMTGGFRITRLSDIRVSDKTLSSTNTNNWGLNSILVYEPTAVTGTYAAKAMSRIYNDNVDGNKVVHSGLVKLDSDGITPIGTNGVVTYSPSSNGGAKYTLDGIDYGVATLAGGSRECNLNAPNQSGSGLPIIMTWTNLSFEAIMPGNYNCQTAILIP